MNRYFTPILLIIVISFSSCLFQRRRPLIPIPDPDTDIMDFSLPVYMEDILESKNGAAGLPLWLAAFISGGINETEKIDSYSDKYLFVGMSEGLNFTAMEKWADNFSPVRDTAMLAAGRIENRLISSASLYPDDEYGIFFESMVKRAYSTVYPGSEKEDTHWIKMRTDNGFIYIFYVLISMDKENLNKTVNDMIAASIPPSSAVTQSQRNAINRLRDNFFEGF